jgi:hypothetical protein
MRPDDIEKIHGSPSLHSMSQHELTNSSSNDPIKDPILEPKPQTKFRRWLASFKGVEARGIEPVPLEEREPLNSSTSLHMMLLWFSMSLATNNIVVGSMGTLVLGLSFKDAAICAVLGNLVGTTTIGYMSTWGPRSGNRTLVIFDPRDRKQMSVYQSFGCLLMASMGTMIDCCALLHGVLPQQSLHRSEHPHQSWI